MTLHPTDFDHRAIGPFADHCDGYGNPGAEGLGYVNVLKVATAVVEKSDDALLDGIVAFDAAETEGTWLGQINMTTASSFCGLAGHVWGHDLAVADGLDQLSPLFSEVQHDATPLPVYDARPLLEAGRALLGSRQERRFPLAPGAHVPCANRSATAYRPRSGAPLPEAGQAYGVWCYLALSIARDRTRCADMFMEDAGLWTADADEAALQRWLDEHRRAVVRSILACGRGQGTAYERTYIAYACTLIPPGHVGTALAVAPYLVLARNALPGGDFARLGGLSLSEWERQVL